MRNARKFVNLLLPGSSVSSLFAISFFVLISTSSQAAVVNYSLENVMLDDGVNQMLGEFSWTYDEGDFENGVGAFTYLEIPFTNHDHTDLQATFDIGTSIEITLEANLHDDGVDITLRLLNPLTPTSSAAINPLQSAYDIGGNGFHAGVFQSGHVVSSALSGVDDQGNSPLAPAQTLTSYPNPFNPRTNIVFELKNDSLVSLEVFDLRGRSLGIISTGAYSSGTHEVIWTGTDGQGQAVPSGRYFARLRTADHVVTRSMTLVR